MFGTQRKPFTPCNNRHEELCRLFNLSSDLQKSIAPVGDRIIEAAELCDSNGKEYEDLTDEYIVLMKSITNAMGCITDIMTKINVELKRTRLEENEKDNS